MLVYALYFLEKHGQYFTSLVLILCKSTFVYTHEKGKNLLYTLYYTLQKYIENGILSDTFSVFGQRTIYKHCLMANIVSHFVIIHSIYTNMK